MRKRPTASRGPSSKLIYEERRLQAIARRWNKKAADWDLNLQDPACHLNEDDAYQRFLGQALLSVRRRKAFCMKHGAIDAGCATGLVLAEIVASFAWGVGVDISPEMIRIARDKKIRKAKFLAGDCFELTKLCPPAGAILSRGVLLSHYGPQQGAQLLKSAYDCLVEKGFLLLDFLNQGGRDKFRHKPLNKTFYEADEVCALAGKAGFRRRMVYGEHERRVRMLLAEK